MSEFGKGFSYCLGLFLAHSERILGDESVFNPGKNECGESWFNGAADHLFGFDADNAPLPLRERCISFKDKCIGLRMGFLFVKERGITSATWEDVKSAIQEAKDILLEYDRLNGFDVEKGDWE